MGLSKKVLSADERIRLAKKDAERDFECWLREGDAAKVKEAADERVQAGVLDITAVRCLVFSEVLQAHWPTRKYKEEIIRVLSGEPYHMENYAPLLNQRQGVNRFAGI